MDATTLLIGIVTSFVGGSSAATLTAGILARRKTAAEANGIVADNMGKVVKSYQDLKDELIEEMNRSKGECKSEIDKLRIEVTNRDAALERLQIKVGELQFELDAVKKERDELRAKVDKLSKQVNGG